MKKIVSKGDLPSFAKDFLKELVSKEDKATVVGFYGDLGAGKTTFTQELAVQLGVKQEITSPTFTLQSTYQTTSDKFEHLVHIDLYRIENIEEVRILRLDQLFNEPKTLVLIEWAEKIEKELPDDFVRVRFEHVDNQTREFEIEW